MLFANRLNLCACAVLLLLTAVVRADEPPVQHFWRPTETGYAFDSEDFSARSEAGRGWVSLQVDGAEFLHTSDETGGILWREVDGWVTHYPSGSNMSHDSQLGRRGAVADGTYLTRIVTGWTLPYFTLYAGFNGEGTREVALLLSDEVKLVRLGSPERTVSWMRQVLTRDSKEGRSYHNKSGALVVHESGKALAVHGPVTSAVLKGPDGEPRLALLFECKGFAANEFTLRAVSVPHPEAFVMAPRMAVEAEKTGKEGKGKAGAKIGWPVYCPGQQVEMGWHFGWRGPEPFQGYIEIDIRHSLGGVHFKKRMPVTVAPSETVTELMPVELSRPGASDVWGKLLDQDHRLIAVDRYRMLYDYENYEPKIVSPPDLKEFWDRTLAELAKIPLEPEIKRVFPNTPDWELYEVTFNTWQNQRVWALLRVPANVEKPLPAIVTAHPGAKGWGVNKGPDGVYGSKIKAAPGFVTIQPLIRGHAPDAEDIPFNHPWWGPLESRDAYVARSWYCTMKRAVDYLATRPDLVDMDRVVAKGGSQGGALALVTAALDDRVALCLSDSPSNLQMHELILNYSGFGPSIGNVPEGQTVEDLIDTLSYYDAVNMCPWIEVPTVIGLNVGDLTVHSMGGLAAYKNLTGLPGEEKWFFPGPTHFHANSPKGGAKMKALLQEVQETELTR